MSLNAPTPIEAGRLARMGDFLNKPIGQVTVKGRNIGNVITNASSGIDNLASRVGNIGSRSAQQSLPGIAPPVSGPVAGIANGSKSVLSNLKAMPMKFPAFGGGFQALFELPELWNARKEGKVVGQAVESGGRVAGAAVGTALAAAAFGAAKGAAAGSVIPGAGTLAGLAAGAAVGLGAYFLGDTTGKLGRKAVELVGLSPKDSKTPTVAESQVVPAQEQQQYGFATPLMAQSGDQETISSEDLLQYYAQLMGMGMDNNNPFANMPGYYN